MPAYRFPPCFHPKSRRVNQTILSAAFSMQIKYKRLSPHVPHTPPFSSAIFHAARTLSGSLRSPPSPRGEGFIRRYSFSTYACIRSDIMGEAVFSYRSLPHWGRGTAPAVDRVLSLIVDLRCISSFSFIRLEPYPVGDTRETCHPQTFGHRPIYICGEAATTTLNPQP